MSGMKKFGGYDLYDSLEKRLEMKASTKKMVCCRADNETGVLRTGGRNKDIQLIYFSGLSHLTVTRMPVGVGG